MAQVTPTPTATKAPAIAHCPALFLAAPASGQGKTTITAALALSHLYLCRNVHLFKFFPDYLYPHILLQASCHPLTQFFFWFSFA